MGVLTWRDRLAPYLPWTDGRGRAASGSPGRLSARIACSVGYLVLSWGLFVPLSEADGGKWRIDEDRVGSYVFRVPDLSENVPRALRSLATAPFLNHDSVQLVYVTLLVLLFGAVFEAREGARTTVLVFFGSACAAAVGGGVLLHLLYPEVSNAPFLATAWARTWSGGSAGCFGLMGGLAARARRPWPLLALFALWELGVLVGNLRSYTTVFHFAALAAGYLAVRHLVPPRSRTRL